MLPDGLSVTVIRSSSIVSGLSAAEVVEWMSRRSAPNVAQKGTGSLERIMERGSGDLFGNVPREDLARGSGGQADVERLDAIDISADGGDFTKTPCGFGFAGGGAYQ